MNGFSLAVFKILFVLRLSQFYYNTFSVELFVFIIFEFVELLECIDSYQILEVFSNFFFFLSGFNISNKACSFLFSIFLVGHDKKLN